MIALLALLFQADDLVIDSYSIQLEGEGAIYLRGEVCHPKEIFVKKSIPLKHVLEGQLRRASNLSHIKVTRGERIMIVHKRHIDELPEEALLLYPGDCVEVPTYPLFKIISYFCKVKP